MHGLPMDKTAYTVWKLGNSQSECCVPFKIHFGKSDDLGGPKFSKISTPFRTNIEWLLHIIY